LKSFSGLLYPPRKIPDDAKRLTIIAIGPQSLKLLALRLETVQQAICVSHQPKARQIPPRCSERLLRLRPFFSRSHCSSSIASGHSVADLPENVIRHCLEVFPSPPLRPRWRSGSASHQIRADKSDFYISIYIYERRSLKSVDLSSLGAAAVVPGGERLRRIASDAKLPECRATNPWQGSSPCPLQMPHAGSCHRRSSGNKAVVGGSRTES